MRITFVEHKLNLRTGGGSNYTLHHMATALVQAGHDVSILTVVPAMNAYPADLPYRVIEEPLAGDYLGLRGKLALAAVLERREAATDLYQLESPSFIMAGGLYRRCGGAAPVVARLHNYTFFCSNVARMDADCYRHCTLLDNLSHRPAPPAMKLLRAPVQAVERGAGRLTANQVDRFIALSPAVAAIHARYGLDPRKMAIIPPALDYATLARRARDSARPAPDPRRPYRLLYAGRLETAKGVDVLLRAAASLDFPVAVDIVGAGPSRAGLERLADDLGLAGRVAFHGWVTQDEIAARYLAADLAVHPARWPEPAGRTVLEAMALGVPLVVADLGGPPWLAADAALTFPPGDHRRLAARVAALRGDPALAARLGAAGRERAQHFDRGRVVHDLLALYHDLCPALPLVATSLLDAIAGALSPRSQ